MQNSSGDSSVLTTHSQNRPGRITIDADVLDSGLEEFNNPPSSGF
jgi:hypothetical protein